MNFECQPCGIFGCLLYHQEDEVIDPIIFAATLGLGDRINKLVSSNFMGMVSSVSVIFDTGAGVGGLVRMIPGVLLRVT